MKTHTSDYKENVNRFGRQLDSIISYRLNNEDVELGAEELNYVNPHYESGILKSTMKQLDIDSNVDIPLNTQINYQFGVKIGNGYEYVNYGNYIVYSSEKQEDTNSYKIICYDKMLYSMVPYRNMNITYPITINNYINIICQTLGLTFKNNGEQFVNYNKQIQSELYLDNGNNTLDYTFRDVLDELAQVTASTICINEITDDLEIRYINETNDVIDEEYLKNVNVNFGEKYGPINSVVLSRSAESDNVYLKDDQSISQNGLCEIKIKDNQIMNFNDRADYLPGIFGELNGLEYYLNDFTSTGITYYDLCDRYTVKIGENNYSCVMFNNNTNVTQGLEELVYTDRPEEGETDYMKADKTDRKINQTYLIVDKQNQTISSVVSTVTQQGSQISTITQTVDGISTEVSNKVGNNEVISKINQTPEQITINANKVNLQGYVTATDLSGSGTTTINGSNITTGTIDASQVNVSNINANNISTGTIDASQINITNINANNITSGTITGRAISGGSLSLNSSRNDSNIIITSTAYQSNATNKIVGDGFVVSCDNEELIDVRLEGTSDGQGGYAGHGGAVWLKDTYTDLSLYLTANNLTFSETETANMPIQLLVDNGVGEISTNKMLSDEVQCESFKVKKSNLTHVPVEVQIDSNNVGWLYFNDINNDGSAFFNVNQLRYELTIGSSLYSIDLNAFQIYLRHGSNYTDVSADSGVVHSSKEEYKKNIELKNNNLDLIKKANVYNYLFKNEEDNAKPHIGLVIGDKYNTPDEIISKDGTGINLNDMCGVMWGAIKEQQEIIEKLEKRIEKLEKEK